MTLPEWICATALQVDGGNGHRAPRKRRTLTRALVASSALLVAGRAFAQAEAAPESYEPPSNLSVTPEATSAPARPADPSEPKWVFALNPRLVVPMGTSLGLPRIGFGAGLSVGRALVYLGKLRIGLGLSFSYERVQRDRVYSISSETLTGQQDLSQASFTFDVRFDALLAHDFLRPWLTFGPGFSIGDYKAPPIQPDDSIAKLGVTGVVRVGAGLGFRVWRSVEVGPHVEVVPTFGGPAVGMNKVGVFQPGNFSAALDLGFRF